jgi:2-hydroxy-3-keto-5-methylthiopentenyl-1-phosphate phosphatase
MGSITSSIEFSLATAFHRYRLLQNQLTIHGNNGDKRYRLALPFSQAACESGAAMCKCRCVRAAAGTRVYVGDGRSDFCVANEPELVFAKGNLAEFCERRSIAFLPYRQFDDVAQALKTTAATPLRRPQQTPTPALA